VARPVPVSGGPDARDPGPGSATACERGMCLVQGGRQVEGLGESHDPEELEDQGMRADEQQLSAPGLGSSTGTAQQRQAEAVQELGGAEVDHDRGGRTIRRRVQFRSDVNGGGDVYLAVEFDDRVSVDPIGADVVGWRWGVPGHDCITVRSTYCPPRI
jgi:hypothetical protein